MDRRARWTRWIGIAVLVTACADAETEPLGPVLLDGVHASVADSDPSLSIYGWGEWRRGSARPCRSAHHRAFDFWVGQWNVENAGGDRIATSIIRSELDGCVIMEDFINIGGFRGRSLSVWDPAERRWFQTFVDNIIGGSYRLEGRAQRGGIVMRAAQDVFTFGVGVQHRVSEVLWTANPDRTVRQTFVESFDGRPATTTFDGLYRRADELDRAEPLVLPLCRQNPAFRELDFLLGEWRIRALPGVALGTSIVTADLNDCLIQQDFLTPRGYRLRAFAYFDFVASKWFLTLADNRGSHIELSGAFADGRLVMTGREVPRSGKPFLVRMTLHSKADGVMQSWEVSHDEGETWREALVLGYQRP